MNSVQPLEVMEQANVQIKMTGKLDLYGVTFLKLHWTFPSVYQQSLLFNSWGYPVSIRSSIRVTSKSPDIQSLVKQQEISITNLKDQLLKQNVTITKLQEQHQKQNGLFHLTDGRLANSRSPTEMDVIKTFMQTLDCAAQFSYTYFSPTGKD